MKECIILSWYKNTQSAQGTNKSFLIASHNGRKVGVNFDSNFKESSISTQKDW